MNTASAYRGIIAVLSILTIFIFLVRDLFGPFFIAKCCVCGKRDLIKNLMSRWVGFGSSSETDNWQKVYYHENCKK